jgi:hypothetical protein
MSLEQLKTTFDTQMTIDGYITVNAATLASANLTAIPEFDTLLKNDLLLAMPPLTVIATTISDPSNNTLTVTGTTTILRLTNITVTLIFSIDADDITQLLLESALASTWKFTDSFPFTPTYPADALVLDLPTYVFTTTVKPTYQWQKQNIELVQGLNFVSYLLFQGPLIAVPLFISSEQDRVLFNGVVDCSKMGAPTYAIYPLIELLGNIPGGVVVPGLTVKNPGIRFSISATDVLLDPNDPTSGNFTSYDSTVYFSMDLQIGENEEDICQFRVPLLQESEDYVFGIIPGPHTNVTISSIVDLLAGNNFLAVIPEVIQDYFLESIVLKGFTTSFHIPTDSTTLPSISSFGASIGTNEIWKIGTFEIEEIDLRYNLLFSYSEVTQKTTTSTLAYFSAKFQFYTQLFPGYFMIEMLQEGVNELTIAARYEGDVSLDEIITVMSGNTLTVPEQLSAVTFSDFGVYFNSDSSGNTYSFEGQAAVDFPIDILGTTLDLNLQVNVDWLAGKSTLYTLRYRHKKCNKISE